MNSATLVFKPDGLCVGLYTEIIELWTLGRLRIQRASRIEFDEAHQAWRVKDRAGFPLFTSPSRQTCIEWEREYFSRKLEG